MPELTPDRRGRRRRGRLVRQFARDDRGVQLIEFALTLPFVFAGFGYAIEDCNLAITNMRLSQYTLNLADNASRVGIDAGSGVTRLREADVNDVLQGTRLESDPLKLTTYGRVTLSSLENKKQSYDTAAVQRIHWQRCIGKRSDAGYGSSYGTTTTNAGTSDKAADAGTTATAGMGAANPKVKAPEGGGVMFVEINYDYQPLFGTLFFRTPRKLHFENSFMVRDNRDFSQLHNPSPAATRQTCNLYNS